VVRLATPLAAAGVLTPALSVYDAWLVQVLPESYHLGSVAVGTMLFNYCYWAFAFLRFATVGFTAQSLGAGDATEVKRVLIRTAAVSVALGALIVAAVLPFGPMAVAQFASSPEVEGFAWAYVAIRIWSVPAAFMNYALLGWFIGQQRNGLNMQAELVRVAASMALGFVFVRILGWGIVGVALAPAIAEHLALLYAVVRARGLWRGHAGAWTLREVFDWTPFRRMLAVSRDLFIRTQCLLVAFMGFTAGGAAFGDDVLAANATLMNLYLLLAYPLGAFGQVTSAKVGWAVGARQPAMLRQAIGVTAQTALGGAALCAAVRAGAGAAMVDALTGIEAVRAAARDYLPFAAALPLVAVMSFQLDGAAIGATRTGVLRNSLMVATAAYVAAHLTLPAAFGNAGLWLAFAVFMGVRSAAYAVALPSLRTAAD
jgi:MATE family multidrug resistance protein